MIEPLYPDYFYTEDKIRIFYSKNFKKEDLLEDDVVLIFNYGLVCNSAHYREQIPFFHKAGFKIIYHDYRFHFGSEGTGNIEDCTFNNIVRDMESLFKDLGIKKTLHVGHSMGVNITLEYAKRNPTTVVGMILISGTVLAPQDIMFDSNYTEIATPYIRSFTKNFPKSFELIWKTQYMNPLVRYIVLRGGFNTKQVGDEFVQIYMKKISELPSEIFLQLLDQMKNHDILQDLESIQIKSLVIGGDKDQVIPNYLQKILHKHLPNSELYIVKDGSHVPQVDFPETINERILSFVNNI